MTPARSRSPIGAFADPGMPSAGFSLLECLVAAVLVSLVAAMLVPVIARGVRLARLGPRVADLDQRMRVVGTSLHRALESAGAGAPSLALAPTFAGRVPVVFPALRGVLAGDAPDAAFSDRLTVLVAETSGWDIALAMSMSSASSLLFLQAGPPCPVADPRCGFRPGDAAVLSDRLGSFDLLRIVSSTGGVLAHQPSVLSHVYATSDDARVARADIRQYRFDAVHQQLRAADGLGNEAPTMDQVTAFQCEYYGVAAPPTGVPPPLGMASCLTNADGTPRLGWLAGGTGGIVKLPLSLFQDGPFCGNGAMRFDADLFRVRRVVVRVRVIDEDGAEEQWTASALGRLGTEREVMVDVAPRNLESR